MTHCFPFSKECLISSVLYLTFQDPMVSQGLQCLKGSVSSTTSLYAQALLAYTFSLAGEMDLRNILLEKLDQQAIISGTLTGLGVFLKL